MMHSAGELNDGVLKFDFDRRLMLQFCGSVVTSDQGESAKVRKQTDYAIFVVQKSLDGAG